MFVSKDTDFGWQPGRVIDVSSWHSAYQNLTEALGSGGAETKIWVASGIYKATTETDRTASFVMKENVAIYGGFSGTESLKSQRDPVSYPTILSGDVGVEGAVL